MPVLTPRSAYHRYCPEQIQPHPEHGSRLQLNDKQTLNLLNAFESKQLMANIFPPDP